MFFERNLGTCRSWNRLFGHTPTSFNCQAGSTECCRICRTIAPVAMILKGSYEHPVSCLMCNDMQRPNLQESSFTEVLSFYVVARNGHKLCVAVSYCIAVCGSTLVLVMPRMILCKKRSRKTRDRFFTMLLPRRTVRAATEPKFKMYNLKNTPSPEQPKGAPPCNWA